ncbi:MAG: hypothetical protein ACHP9T_04740 [Caulobacterales bacterium]
MLGQMAEWVATGRPPRGETLRQAGLTAAGDENAGLLRLARKAFVRDWGFSIPSEEAVTALCALSPLVEIGAGAGYWSALLTAAGADIVATDAQVSGEIGYRFRPGHYCEMQPLAASDAVRRFPERNVFCSWPTMGEAWAADAARQIAPGRHLALISDGRGGITATDELFDVLAEQFVVSAEVEIPQFPKVNDRLTVYRRTQA